MATSIKIIGDTMNYQKITIYTLLLSLFTLAWMVPGGPVETRSFSNILPEIVMGFNIFLTSLMIVSIALVYFMYKKQKWAYQLTGVVGMAFALVFLLDLGGIFPVSLDPMQTLLFVMEVIGLILGVLLMWLSYKMIQVTHDSAWSGKFKIPKVWIIAGIMLLIFGVYIVYFATSSALR